MHQMHHLLLVVHSEIHPLFLVSHLNHLGQLHQYHQEEGLLHHQDVPAEVVPFHLQ